jgi:glucitol operon activator protein
MRGWVRELQWWHSAILLFIIAWFLQIFLSFAQSKHYQQTVRMMSNQASGFLGVGVVKRRLGIGSVVILVTDLNYVVTGARELTGVTVFKRFKKADDFIGRSVNELEREGRTGSRYHAVKLAVEKIKEQVVKN